MLTGSTLQVEPQEKKKTPKGRAKKRITYTRRFVNVTMTGGKRKVRNTTCSVAASRSTTLWIYNFRGIVHICLYLSLDEPQPDHLNLAVKGICGRRGGRIGAAVVKKRFIMELGPESSGFVA